MSEIERLNPNLDLVAVGSMFTVKTDTHNLLLEVRPVGPQTKGFLLSLVSAEPPIAESSFYPTEVYVQDNEVMVGEKFELSTLFPILSKTAFTALEITSYEGSIEEK